MPNSTGFMSEIWDGLRAYLILLIIDTLICGLLLVILYSFRKLAEFMGILDDDVLFAFPFALMAVAFFFFIFFVVGVFRIVDQE